MTEFNTMTEFKKLNLNPLSSDSDDDVQKWDDNDTESNYSLPLSDDDSSDDGDDSSSDDGDDSSSDDGDDESSPSDEQFSCVFVVEDQALFNEMKNQTVSFGFLPSTFDIIILMILFNLIRINANVDELKNCIMTFIEDIGEHVLKQKLKLYQSNKDPSEEDIIKYCKNFCKKIISNEFFFTAFEIIFDSKLDTRDDTKFERYSHLFQHDLALEYLSLNRKEIYRNQALIAELQMKMSGQSLGNSNYPEIEQILSRLQLTDIQQKAVKKVKTVVNKAAVKVDQKAIQVVDQPIVQATVQPAASHSLIEADFNQSLKNSGKQMDALKKTVDRLKELGRISDIKNISALGKDKEFAKADYPTKLEMLMKAFVNNEEIVGDELVAEFNRQWNS